MFERNTYITLELPESVASKVHDIRVNQKDEYRAFLPNEITIAGSSGVGPISSKQSLDDLVAILNKIAQTTKPITARFDRVIRFPNTDIVVLTLREEDPFIKLHDKIKFSGIKFEQIDYDYKPHCTLRSRSPLLNSEMDDLKKIKFEEKFVLDTISVYSMPAPMKLIHRVKLTG